MNYRKFGHISDSVSALGFGAMRLPTGENGSIERKTAVKMIRRAIDGGVNYVDTAYPYHGGESEGLVAEALQDGYRRRVFLADKLPVWKVERREDFSRFLETQLQRLGDEYIDLYLIHALNDERWEKTKRLGILEEAEEAKREGKIGHIGFSFHDEYPVFHRILEEYEGWEFCQIQYNLMDIEHQAGERGLKEAASLGIPVVVMEPLKGGMLANRPAESVAELWDEFSVGRDHIDLSLRYILDKPEVSLVLSGMSSLEHVEGNLESASKWYAGCISDEEAKLYRQVRNAYRSLKRIDCTSCGYCIPCPEGVEIPKIFELYNNAYRYGDNEESSRFYRFILDEAKRADKCTACGTCEEVCPQGLEVIELLREADELLSGRKPL